MMPVLALTMAMAEAASTLPPGDVPFQLTAAPRPAVAPAIDGILDAVWAAAPVAAAVMLFEPNRGAPDPHPTAARILVDDKNVYAAFEVWDPDPVAAQIIRRDRLVEDSAGPAGFADSPRAST
jgi:hypothetical protein